MDGRANRSRGQRGTGLRDVWPEQANVSIPGAVQDTATGKDVYKALAVRLSLYIAVALYAWAAIYVLETLRAWRKNGALTRTLGARDKQQK